MSISNNTKQKKQYLKHFKFFYSYLGSKILIGLLLSVLVGLLDGFGLAMFLPLLQMIDGQEVSSSEGMGNLSFLAKSLESFGFDLNITVVMFFILILFTLKGIFRFLESVYNVIIQQKFILEIRSECVSNFSEFKYKNYIKTDTGRIQNTLSSEVSRVVLAYMYYRMFLQNAISVVVYIILAFLSNPLFAIFVAFGAFITNFLFAKIYSRTKEFSKKLTSFGHIYEGLLIQSVSFFKYLKATGSFSEYSKKIKETITNIEQNNKKIGFVNAFLGAVKEPIVLYVVISVILVQVLFFDVKLGMMILSLLLFQRALNFVLTAQSSWNSFLSMSGSLENIQDFLHELKSNKEQRGEITLDKFNQNLNLQEVMFSYKENDPILKNINLQIIKNKTIAFVGESGSGKTTLVNILSGLLPIDSGQMLIDGIDAKEIDMRTFQKRIGYITQEPVIFDDTIFNNVTFWDEKTPENLEKFWVALQKAAIVEMVNELPEKEDAPLGNNGVMVSGGQKQRISIARELYKDIDILIMDEATSALDSETERVIQNNIEELKGKYTILIVAHRLSTIKTADEIVVMKKGEIIDKGNFEYLIQNNPSFQKMVNLQELS